MHSAYVFLILTVIVISVLALGCAINELLTKLVGKFFAYVVMLAGFGVALLALGLHGAGPSLISIGSGMLGAAFVFTVMFTAQRFA